MMARQRLAWLLIPLGFLLLLAECPRRVTAGSLNYDDCGSTSEILDFRASGCSGNHCTVHKGTNVTVEIDFIPGQSSDTLLAEVFGIISGVPNPFPPVPQDACQSLANGAACPVWAGQLYTYSVVVEVLPEYPSLPVTVLWELKADFDYNKMVCIRVSDVNIV